MKRTIAILGLLLISSPGWAKTRMSVSNPPPPSFPTFFVSASGNDSNSGTNSSSPWLTIAKVQSMQASFAPDTHILFNRGDVWTNQELTITHLVGSSGHPIVIGNYGTGALPVIDGFSTKNTCINAESTTASFVTVDGIECRNTTEYGITWQTTNGVIHDMTVQNSYIHNTGPGACSGCGSPHDDGNYRNQLDGEDFGKGAGINNWKFINNVVNNCGGHNCLQVHYDGGSPIVQSNVVGPGCVHNCIDVKGSGTFGTTQAKITQNIATTGVTTCSGNCQAAFYIANSFHGGVGSDNLVTQNVAYGSALDFQSSPDANCTPSSGTHCPQHEEVYNNTWYTAGAVADALFASDCEAPSAGCGFNEDTTMVVNNTIYDGGTVHVNSLVHFTDDYNDRGGAQGQVSNDTSAGAHSISNRDPLYTNASGHDFTLTAPSTLHTAGLGGLPGGLNSIGAYP